ncbi:MAG: hypothetical protein Q7Q73_05820 [Verrucomicrobiota bacterium JB024]|nr:hypothetical protein [Verrucomicrobiota bacterium JB024]
MSTPKPPSKKAKKATKKAPRKALLNPSDFILGFDSEWVSRGAENEILSYQWHMITPGGSGGGIFFVKDLNGGKRLELPAFVSRVLEAAKGKDLFNHYPKALVMVAHFSLADLNAFDDFHTAIKSTFDNVRKTYVSLREPTKISVTDSNGHKREVEITLRDSKIIAPAGSRLEDLGELHGLPKIKLPEGMIERMDVLLEKDPDLFMRYAVRDAEVTALHAIEDGSKGKGSDGYIPGTHQFGRHGYRLL